MSLEKYFDKVSLRAEKIEGNTYGISLKYVSKKGKIIMSGFGVSLSESKEHLIREISDKTEGCLNSMLKKLREIEEEG